MEPTLCWEEIDPQIVRLSLDHGRGNALSLQLVDELESALGDLEALPPRALVLDGGRGKLFCGGFDLTEVLTFNERDLRRFFRRFFELLARLAELPCPTLAAVHGSAIAGGLLLSLGCDLRVVQYGDLEIGLTEVDLGVAVPAGGQVLLAERTSPSASLRLSLFGSLISPEEALDLGYANVLAEDARAEAIALAKALACKPGDAAGLTKAVVGAELARRVREADARGFEAFFSSWRSAAAQEKLRALATKLAGL